MTKSVLVVAGCLLVASAAWAGPPPGPQGSGNNVSTALNPPAPAPAPTPFPSALPPPGPQGSGNNVSAALAPPKPAPVPSPAPSSAPSNANASNAGANQAMSFNPMAYGSRTDCLNAAQAAHQPLSQCNGVAAK
jgi:hypothetical protein